VTQLVVKRDKIKYTHYETENVPYLPNRKTDKLLDLDGCSSHHLQRRGHIVAIALQAAVTAQFVLPVDAMQRLL